MKNLLSQAMRFLRLVLLPLSALVALIVFLRNRLYDAGIFKSSKGALPTVVIGNLSLGGTGKTPHSENLIRFLSETKRTALLSRGYGRKTKGFLMIDEKTAVQDSGDEPFQIKAKFPAIEVAVCENRLTGLEELKRLTDTEVVILDDAFQHRPLIGDLNILLTVADHPLWNDCVWPAGNLRDNRFEKRRADIIVVTKCPPDLDDHAMDRMRKRIQPSQDQQVFFTTIAYQQPIQSNGPKWQSGLPKQIVGFAGLAKSALFEQHLRRQFDLVKFQNFTDHHFFSEKEIRLLWNECDKFAAPDIALFTTEKDAVRLKGLKGIEDIPVFYIPIEIQFLRDEAKFRTLVLEKLTAINRK